MSSIFDFIFYILIFFSVYVQVFFFVTFLENRKKIIIRRGATNLNHYPAVTIVVPCWNEEDTVGKTVHSLFNLNYPKDKLNIFLVDDGSTDNTWKAIQKFAGYPNIKIFHKENGGKHTALNLGLENLETDFFGCLDADSFADPEALVRLMSYFEKDSGVMAVVPSVVVHDPKSIVQNAQEVDYNMGVFLKKMLGFLGAIDVTPGPLTIFQRKVFDDLGYYRHGHSTEDMEIAYRMQKNNYRIEHCPDAHVYTNTPRTIAALYRQRIRWIYGFLNNAIDYRDVLFKKKYGNFALFTLPTRVISIVSVSYLFGHIIYNFGDFLYSKIIKLKTVGLDLNIQHFSFDPFFINTKFFLFLVILVYGLVILSVVLGRKITREKNLFSLKVLYFFPIFSLISPFWLLRAVWNTIRKRKPAWR